MNESEKDAEISIPLKVPEKDFRIAFIASLTLKSIGAGLQLIFGLFLLVSGGATSYIISLIQKELIEDPNDFFATHAASAAAHLSPDMQLFGAAYLLSHGIVKAVLIWALLKNKLWAYPAALIVFSLFIVYQLVHLSKGNWVFLVPFALFELLLLYLIYHEYRYLQKRHRRG